MVRNFLSHRTIVLLILLMAPVVLTAQEKSEKQFLAVLDFRTSGIEKVEVDVFIDYLSSHIINTNLYRVIDRMQRETILKEIAFSVSDTTDERYQLQIGKLISADRIVVGSIGKVGDRYLLTMKLVDVQTGESLRSGSERYLNFNELIDDSKRLAFQFVGADLVAETRPAAPATTPATAAPAATTATSEVTSTQVVTPPTPPRPAGRRGSAFEGTLGYVSAVEYDYSYDYEGDVSFLTLSAGYLYQFNNFFSLGANVAFLLGGEVPIFPVFPGLKAVLGNKVDGFAVSLGLGAGMLNVGAYFRNLMVDLSYYYAEDGYGYEVMGLGIDIGYSFYIGR